MINIIILNFSSVHKKSFQSLPICLIKHKIESENQNFGSRLLNRIMTTSIIKPLLYKLQYIWFLRNQNMHTKRRGMIFSWNYLVEQCKCILFFVKSTAWERKGKKIIFEIFPWNQMDHKSLGIISWNHIFSNFFGENVTFTNFLQKMLEREFQ